MIFFIKLKNGCAALEGEDLIGAWFEAKEKYGDETVDVTVANEHEIAFLSMLGKLGLPENVVDVDFSEQSH